MQKTFLSALCIFPLGFSAPVYAEEKSDAYQTALAAAVFAINCDRLRSDPLMVTGARQLMIDALTADGESDPTGKADSEMAKIKSIAADEERDAILFNKESCLNAKYNIARALNSE